MDTPKQLHAVGDQTFRAILHAMRVVNTHDNRLGNYIQQYLPRHVPYECVGWESFRTVFEGSTQALFYVIAHDPIPNDLYQKIAFLRGMDSYVILVDYSYTIRCLDVKHLGSWWRMDFYKTELHNTHGARLVTEESFFALVE